MKTLIQHGVCRPNARVVDLFNAEMLGAPFAVILRHSVEVTYNKQTGEVEDYNIPDFDGLKRVVALTRVLHPRKLTGADIKFLRKVIGIKAKDLAKKIEVTAAHLSRCENTILPISPASEKLLRVFIFKTALKLASFECAEKRQKLEDALDELFDDVTPMPVHDSEDKLELSFTRRQRPPVADNDEAAPERSCWDVPKYARG